MVTVIVFGLPGSGKSFIASRLAELINASYISSDELRMQLYAKRTYTEKEKLSVYDTMLLKMQEHLKQGENVVLDATFFKNTLRQKFLDTSRLWAPVVFIEVTADENLTRERLKNKRLNSEADFEVYEKLKAEWEPLKDPHLILKSTNENLTELLQQAEDYIHSKNDKRRN
jgi:predicted kinase